MLQGTAFSPGGISSFFQAVLNDSENKPIKDFSRIGSRGGGFTLSKGVTTNIVLEETNKAPNQIHVIINNNKTYNANTTLFVVNHILSMVDQNYQVRISHQIEPPIGSGFGTSGGGALTTALILGNLLKLKLTYTQLARIAHIAEIKCNTGLGTVSGLAHGGGLILITNPGSPGICTVDNLIVDPDIKLVTVSLEPMAKASILQSSKKMKIINRIGIRTMDEILDEPTLVQFFKSCKKFATKSRLMREDVKRLIEKAEKGKAIGATQNMIGHSMHAAVNPEDLDHLIENLRPYVKNHQIMVSSLSFEGAHLTSAR